MISPGLHARRRSRLPPSLPCSPELSWACPASLSFSASEQAGFGLQRRAHLPPYRERLLSRNLQCAKMVSGSCFPSQFKTQSISKRCCFCPTKTEFSLVISAFSKRSPSSSQHRATFVFCQALILIRRLR